MHPSGIIPPPHEAPDEVVQCLKCKGDMADTLFLQADATNLRTGAEFEVNMMASMARVLVSNPLPTAEYYSVLINIVNQADGGIGAAEAMTDATQQLSLKYTAGIKLNDLNEVRTSSIGQGCDVTHERIRSCGVFLPGWKVFTRHLLHSFVPLK